MDENTPDLSVQTQSPQNQCLRTMEYPCVQKKRVQKTQKRQKTGLIKWYLPPSNGIIYNCKTPHIALHLTMFRTSIDRIPHKERSQNAPPIAANQHQVILFLQ